MCEICKCARTAFDSYNDNNLALFLVNPQFKNDELIIIHYRGKSLEFAIAKLLDLHFTEHIAPLLNPFNNYHAIYHEIGNPYKVNESKCDIVSK